MNAIILIGISAYFITGWFVVKSTMQGSQFEQKLGIEAGRYFAGEGSFYFILTILGIVLWPALILVGALLPNRQNESKDIGDTQHPPGP